MLMLQCRIVKLVKLMKLRRWRRAWDFFLEARRTDAWVSIQCLRPPFLDAVNMSTLKVRTVSRLQCSKVNLRC
jgi:hypothetical protein